MKKILLLFICSDLLFSCNENEGPVVCGVENPAEDLAWIKKEIQSIGFPNSVKYSYLMQASYQEKTVFFFGYCNPLMNFALIVKDCEGNQVLGETTLSDLKDQKVIWKPSDSECNFS